MYTSLRFWISFEFTICWEKSLEEIWVYRVRRKHFSSHADAKTMAMIQLLVIVSSFIGLFPLISFSRIELKKQQHIFLLWPFKRFMLFTRDEIKNLSEHTNNKLIVWFTRAFCQYSSSTVHPKALLINIQLDCNSPVFLPVFPIFHIFFAFTICILLPPFHTWEITHKF